MLFHTESLEAAGSWLPEAAAAVLEFEAEEAATTASAEAMMATSKLLFLKVHFPLMRLCPIVRSKTAVLI